MDIVPRLEVEDPISREENVQDRLASRLADIRFYLRLIRPKYLDFDSNDNARSGNHLDDSPIGLEPAKD